MNPSQRKKQPLPPGGGLQKKLSTTNLELGLPDVAGFGSCFHPAEKKKADVAKFGRSCSIGDQSKSGKKEVPQGKRYLPPLLKTQSREPSPNDKSSQSSTVGQSTNGKGKQCGVGSSTNIKGRPSKLSAGNSRNTRVKAIPAAGNNTSSHLLDQNIVLSSGVEIQDTRPPSKEVDTALTKKQVLPEISTTERILLGNYEGLPPPRTNFVRMFLSSTFSDMRAERNEFARTAYPQLKQFCADLGLDFQLMDMRWGVTEMATDDHSVESICMEEIQRCQRLSRGPNFVTLLGDRYGFCPLRPVIDAEEFESIMKFIPEDEVESVKMWYRRDSNAIKPEYVLQTISSHLKHYTDVTEENKEKKAADSATWWKTKEMLETTLRKSALLACQKNLISQKQCDRYYMSVTELEVNAGLLKAENPSASCLCFIRDLENLDMDMTDPAVKKYTDAVEKDGKLEKNAPVAEKLRSLIHEKIGKTLPADNIVKIPVVWKAGGIDRNKHEEHEKYIDKLLCRMVDKLKDQITSFIKQEEEEMWKEANKMLQLKKKRLPVIVKKPEKSAAGIMSHGFDFYQGVASLDKIFAQHNMVEDASDVTEGSDPNLKIFWEVIYGEILHHLVLGRNMCQIFCGREEELSKVKKYLMDSSEKKPLVIHGKPGIGKSAFMAYVAKKARDWLKSTAVVLRFLGSSPKSSKIKKLLSSICHQISLTYDGHPNNRPLKKVSIAIKHLHNLLNSISIRHGKQQSLVILLDSVGQLLPEQGAHRLQWLPKICPPNVHFIISMTSDIHHCVEHAHTHLQDNDCFIELGPVPENIGDEIIHSFLKVRGRKLTSDQLALLKNALSGSVNPQYMELVLNEACLWKSYQNVSEITLKPTLNEAIAHIIQRLQSKFGSEVVKTALGYLTLGRNGLSHVEIEDALSLSNRVLTEVYRYHDPPVEGIIRIPTLLWARIYHDLEEHIIERQTFSKTTLYWNNKQFAEGVMSVVQSDGLEKIYHKELADMYLAEKPVFRSIHLKARGRTFENVDRQVSLQPVTAKNLRMLTSLPYHLQKAEDVEMLKMKVFFNLPYVEARIAAFTCMEFMEDLRLSVEAFRDPDMNQLLSCLQISGTTSQRKIFNMGIQILGHLRNDETSSKPVQQLCTQLREIIGQLSKIALEPTFPCFSSDQRALKWYTEGPDEICVLSPDKTQCLLKFLSNTASGRPKFKVLNFSTLAIIYTLQTFESGFSGEYVQSAFSANCQRVYMLYTTCLNIYSSDKGQLLFSSDLNLNSGGLLNCCFAVSSHEFSVALSGQSRLGMLAEQSNSYDEPQFIPTCAMNLGGTTSSSNLLFTVDDKKTISSHSIKAKKGTIGAIVLWNYENETLDTRMALPSPVQKGFLRILHGDNIICGCTNHVINIVNIAEGQIVKQFGAPSKGLLLWDIFQVNSLLALAVKGKNKCQFINYTTGEKIAEMSVKDPIKALHMSGDGQNMVIGDSDGMISLCDVNSQSLLKTHRAHIGKVSYVRVFDDNTVLTLGDDKSTKVWIMEGILNSDDAKSANNNGTGNKNLAREYVLTCARTSDGKYLVTGSDSCGVAVWSIPDGQLVTRATEPNRCDQVLVSGGTPLIVYSLDGTSKQMTSLKLDGDSLEQLWTTSAVTAFQSLDKLGIFSASNESGVIKITKHEPLSLESQQEIHIQNLQNIECSQAVLITEHYFLVKTAAVGKCYNLHVADISKNNASLVACCDDKTKELKQIFCHATTCDGSLLVGVDGEVMTVNTKSGMCGPQQKKHFPSWLKHAHKVLFRKGSQNSKTHENVAVTAVTVTTTQDVVITGAEDGTIVIWRDINYGDAKEKARVVRAHTAVVNCLALSDDGKFFLSGSSDKTVQLYDVESGTKLAKVYVHADVCQVQFLPNTGVILVHAKDMVQPKVMMFYLRNLKNP